MVAYYTRALVVAHVFPLYVVFPFAGLVKGKHPFWVFLLRASFVEVCFQGTIRTTWTLQTTLNKEINAIFLGQ